MYQALDLSIALTIVLITAIYSAYGIYRVFKHSKTGCSAGGCAGCPCAGQNSLEK